ncbi:hypothetical protein HX878_21060 [Pseudomonas veronii]|uniref:hypothetical protein n=1 Tax=Pseudomonas veronii TaxID=76761 RepID=UPI0015A114A7|nr:hypothetical protein [Pseudomonas veronii]NWD57222.1 hypothetical protein [Pseudomonas veronii]
MAEHNDFPGKSSAWLKGRGDAIVYGDDVWGLASCAYEVGSADALDWDSGVQAGLDELDTEQNADTPE